MSHNSLPCEEIKLCEIIGSVRRFLALLAWQEIKLCETIGSVRRFLALLAWQEIKLCETIGSVRRFVVYRRYMRNGATRQESTEFNLLFVGVFVLLSQFRNIFWWPTWNFHPQAQSHCF